MSSAAGTLAETPLAHALVYLRNRKLSGVLELRAPNGRQARIDVWRGAVTFATTTPSVARFGAVAYELGWITADKLDEVCAESIVRQTPEAELLFEDGTLSEAQRDETIAEQVRRRVLHAFTFPPDSRFAFAESTRDDGVEPRIVIDALASVWRGILAFPPEHEMEFVLGRYGDAPLRLVDEEVLWRADFDARERAVCMALRNRAMSIAELHVRHPLPHERTRLLAYFLIISKCVEAQSSHSGTMPARRADSTEQQRECGTSEEPHEPRKHSFTLSCMKIRSVNTLRPPQSPGAVVISPSAMGVDGIRRRASRLGSETPYDTLGLVDGAPTEAVRAAYYRLVRLWHPDRLPPDLAGVEAEATQIFLHMTQAYREITALAVAGT